MDTGDVMECCQSHALPVSRSSFQVQRTTEREFPELESIPLESGSSTVAPVQPLVFIICCEVPPNAACTGFMTTMETVTQLTVILHLSQVLHGHW